MSVRASLVLEPVAFEDALARIAAACARLESETIPLEASAGRVLAERIVAEDDLVPFARSAMDGYAVVAAETQAGTRLFPVRASAYAERGPVLRHEPGTATAVATGAPIPEGADAVVPFENVLALGDAIAFAPEAGVVAGAHVFPPGDDARRGDVLAEPGTVLRSARLALLAAAGHARVRVVKRPRVAVVTSGEEIVAVTERPAFGQIRNSNAIAVASTVASFGVVLASVVHVRDDRDAVRAAIAHAAKRADLVVTTGGASVGERDFIKPALEDLGATFAFRSIAMRPGRPTALATLKRAHVVALPGNPAAVAVALHEVVRPALLGLAGRTETRVSRANARLRGSIHAKGDRTYFAFAELRVAVDGYLEATPLANQCSALTRTSAEANALIVMEPGRGDVTPGDIVPVDIFDANAVRQSSSGAS